MTLVEFKALVSGALTAAEAVIVAEGVLTTAKATLAQAREKGAAAFKELGKDTVVSLRTSCKGKDKLTPALSMEFLVIARKAFGPSFAIRKRPSNDAKKTGMTDAEKAKKVLQDRANALAKVSELVKKYGFTWKEIKGA